MILLIVGYALLGMGVYASAYNWGGSERNGKRRGWIAVAIYTIVVVTAYIALAIKKGEL